MAVEVREKQIDAEEFLQEAITLGRELQEQGFKFKERARIVIDNSQHSSRIPGNDESEFQFNIAIAFQDVRIPRSIGSPGFGKDITSQQDHIFYYPPKAIISSDFSLDQYSFEMVREYKPSEISHTVSLALRSRLERRDTSLDNFPFQPNRLGVRFDLKANPKDRDSLKTFQSRRVDPHILENGHAFGQYTEEGINANLMLEFQNPKSRNYLKCYETEIFVNNQKDNLLVPVVVPQSKWQPEQNHYCLVAGDEGYPLLPLDPDKLTALNITAGFKGERQNPIANLFRGLPLRTSKMQQWYVGVETPEDSLTTLFNSKWKGFNTAVVYRKHQQEPFTGSDIKQMAETMIDVVNNLST